MNNGGVGNYKHKKEDGFNIVVKDNPKTENGIALNSDNIKVKEDGTITFNGKTYKLNLFQLSTGEKLKDGALNADEKKKIAEKVKDILSEKSKGFLGLFPRENKATHLKGMVLTDKRFFRHTTEDEKIVYSKGVGYNKRQEKLFKSIQNTFAQKISHESVKGQKELQTIFDEKVVDLPPHPLDIKMKDKYIFTPFEKDEPSDFFTEDDEKSNLPRYQIELEDVSSSKVEDTQLKEAQKNFFPDIKPPEKGNGFFQFVNNVVDKLKGTSDPYHDYDKEGFVKRMIHDLDRSILKDIDKLKNFLSNSESQKPEEVLDVVKAAADKFLELRQQLALVPDRELDELYQNKLQLFMDIVKLLPLDKENKQHNELVDFIRKLEIEVKKEDIKIEENDLHLEEKEDVNENEPIQIQENKELEIIGPQATQLPFDEAYRSLQRLLSDGSERGWKIGIVDGQMKPVHRELGTSGRKANSNTAKLIVENLLDRIQLLADQAGKDEGKKEDLRALLSLFYASDTWLSQVVGSFPELKTTQIDNIKEKIKPPGKNNFLMTDVIEYIFNPDNNKIDVTDHRSLYDGLPWIGDEALVLINQLNNEIVNKNDENELMRAAEFIIGWMQHREKYYAPNDRYDKALEGVLIDICSKLSSTKNLKILFLLKKHFSITTEGTHDNDNNLKIVKIERPKKNEIIDPRPEDGVITVSWCLDEAKKSKPPTGLDMSFALEMKNMNLYYFSKVKMNEFVKTTWSQDEARKPENKEAPNLTALTEHFNKVTYYIADQILSCENGKQAKALIKFFINVANRLLEQGDFLGFMQISGALKSASVTRLIDNVIDSKNFIAEKFEKLEKITGSNNINLRNMTVLNLTGNNPVVPPMLIYLTDLTFMGVAENTIDNKINAKKIDMICLVKRKIEKALDLVPKEIVMKSDFLSVIQNSKVNGDDIEKKYKKWDQKKKINNPQKIEEKK